MKKFYIIRKANDSDNVWFYAHELYTADFIKMASAIKEPFVTANSIMSGARLLNCRKSDIKIVSRVS